MHEAYYIHHTSTHTYTHTHTILIQALKDIDMQAMTGEQGRKARMALFTAQWQMQQQSPAAKAANKWMMKALKRPLDKAAYAQFASNASRISSDEGDTHDIQRTSSGSKIATRRSRTYVARPQRGASSRNFSLDNSGDAGESQQLKTALDHQKVSSMSTSMRAHARVWVVGSCMQV
jgi:hypothetical protein